MQTVRLIRPHPKTLWGKYIEAIRALKMECRKDKLWILSQYLNRAPFGSNLVGVEAAANCWFGKGAKSLGLGEAALLAGLVQAPSRYRPDRHYGGALKRRDYVLGRMRELGLIDDRQLEAAQSVRPTICRASRPFKAPHFCDWVLRTTRGGVVRTALNADIQAAAERAVSGHSGSACAAVVVDAVTGEVKAMVCSGDYFGGEGGQVNTALAPRPAGSTLKPFLTALTLDRGLVTPETVLLDTPMACAGYRPANFDGKYRGRISVRDALVLSLNVPFVRVLERVGVADFAATLSSLGFRHLDASGATHGLGLAIGNADVSLLELTRAYCALASGAEGVFSRAAGYLVSEMLSGPERSAAAVGHVADVKLPRFAWKTGTSSGYRDAWTVLWNPRSVIGVWCGHLSGGFGDQTLVGAKIAAPLAWSIAREISPEVHAPWYAKPAEVDAFCARRGTMADERERLAIAKPEDGAVFRLVSGFRQQKIAFQASGVDGTTRLWWLVDGVPAGEADARTPFVREFAHGEHEIACASESESATVRIRVDL